MKPNKNFIFRKLDKPEPQAGAKSPEKKLSKESKKRQEKLNAINKKIEQAEYTEALQKYRKAKNKLAKAKRELKKEAQKNPRIAAILKEATTLLEKIKEEIKENKTALGLMWIEDELFEDFEATIDSKKDILALKKSPEEAKLFDAMPKTLTTLDKLYVIDFFRAPLVKQLGFNYDEKLNIATKLSEDKNPGYIAQEITQKTLPILTAIKSPKEIKALILQAPSSLEKKIVTLSQNYIEKSLKVSKSTAKIIEETISKKNAKEPNKIAQILKDIPKLITLINKLEKAGFQRDLGTTTTIESMMARGAEKTTEEFDKFLSLNIPKDIIEDVFITTNPLTPAGLEKAKEIAIITATDSPNKELFQQIMQYRPQPLRAIQAIKQFDKPEFKALSLTKKEKQALLRTFIPQGGDAKRTIEKIANDLAILNAIGTISTKEIKNKLISKFIFRTYMNLAIKEQLQKTLKINESEALILRYLVQNENGAKQIQELPQVLEMIDKLEKAGADRHFAARAAIMSLANSTPEETNLRLQKILDTGIQPKSLKHLLHRHTMSVKISLELLEKQAKEFKKTPYLIGIDLEDPTEDTQTKASELKKAFPKITNDEVVQVLTLAPIRSIKQFTDFAKEMKSKMKRDISITILVAAISSIERDKTKIIDFFETLKASNINMEESNQLINVTENPQMAIALYPYAKQGIRNEYLRTIIAIDPLQNPKAAQTFARLCQEGACSRISPHALKSLVLHTRNEGIIQELSKFIEKSGLPAKAAIAYRELLFMQNLSPESENKVSKYPEFFRPLLLMETPFLTNKLINSIYDIAEKYPDQTQVVEKCFEMKAHVTPDFENLGKIIETCKTNDINAFQKLNTTPEYFYDQYEALNFLSKISDPQIKALTAYIVKTSISETKENLELFAKDPAMPVCKAVYAHIPNNPELVLQIGRNLFLNKTSPQTITKQVVDQAIEEQKQLQKEMENEYQWKNSNVTVFAHNELWEPTNNARDANGNVVKTTRFMRDKTVSNIKKSIENGTYEEFRPTQNPTPEQLKEIKRKGIERAIAAKPPHRLIFNGHGGPEHLYLTNGLAEDVVKGLRSGSKEAQETNTLSTKDVAYILIERSKLHRSAVAKDQVIFLSCFNHTFLRNVAEIVTNSGANHPTYIGSSEYGQFGFSKRNTEDTMLAKVMGVGKTSEKASVLIKNQHKYDSSNITVYRPNKKGQLQQVAEAKKQSPGSMAA